GHASAEHGASRCGALLPQCTHDVLPGRHRRVQWSCADHRDGARDGAMRIGRLWVFAALLASLGACRLDRGCSAGGGGAAPEVEVDSALGLGMRAVEVRQCGRCHQSPNPTDGVLSGQNTSVPGAHAAYGSNLTPDPDTGMDAWDAGSIMQA